MTDAGVYKGPTDARAFNGAGETGHTLSGIFRSYWETHGGLAQQGYPLSEVITESDIPVQYFERAVFEYHKENAGTAYEVLLRRLGADAAASAGLTGPGIPVVQGE
jgi:hypothetical protein